MQPRLSIVIPAYNEASSIRSGKLAQVADWLRGQPFESELIVVDDHSTDETAALAREFATQVITIPHAGKAAAVIAGIRAAAGRWVLFTDMDQATPITEAPRLLSALEDGYDVAAGSRGITRPGAPAARYLLSWGQVALKGLLLGLRITDTQCGFKAFRRRAALEVIDHLVVYAPERLGTLHGPSVTSGFDVEFLLVAQRLGLEIKEVPVRWNYQQTRRVNLLRDARRGLRDLFGILSARARGRYPAPPAPVEIVQLPAAQWREYKALRLEMLQTEPQAFGTTASQASAQPDAFWQKRLADAASGSGSPRSWLLFAYQRRGQLVQRGQLVGMLGAFVEEAEPRSVAEAAPQRVAAAPQGAVAQGTKAHIVSVYITPGARGRGISRRLMLAMLETLRQSGIRTARLGVNTIQQPALSLYQSFGFQVVGQEHNPMGDGQVHEEWWMERDL